MLADAGVTLFTPLVSPATIKPAMSEYGKFTTIKPTPLLSHDNVQAAKEARRKILDAVFQRRAERYRRWLKRMQLKPASDLDAIA